ncbi:hypothetical protein Trydic_g1213 [Trypoxylus dichotomus]
MENINLVSAPPLTSKVGIATVHLIHKGNRRKSFDVYSENKQKKEQCREKLSFSTTTVMIQYWLISMLE